MVRIGNSTVITKLYLRLEMLFELVIFTIYAVFIHLTSEVSACFWANIFIKLTFIEKHGCNTEITNAFSRLDKY